MNKLKATWAPFPQEYSSCSSLKPKYFGWSKEEGIANVWIDNNILNHKGSVDNNFGWFCESTEILPDLKNYLLNHHSHLKSHYRKIFTCDSEIISKDPSFFIFSPAGSNLPWTNPSDFKIYEKSKICSMVCSTKDMTTGHKLRLSVSDELKDKLDLFGGAHGSPKSGMGIGPSSDWWRGREESISPYMFSVVFENSSYENYYTEKITDCFANGTVPIYWGDPRIGEKFDIDGIIIWSESFDIYSLSKELYYSKIDHINKNYDIVESMESADDILYNKILSLL